MPDQLAILGGKPVRSKPFSVAPMIDDLEEQLVLTAIREGNFSRYIGSTDPNIDEILVMPSEEAADIEADWHFLGGKNVRLFSADFAKKFGVKYAVPVNAATTGLSVALAAAGIGPGDQVIVPALSFSASGSSILLFNSIPVFVDVDPRTYCIDPAAIEKAISPHTKAIMPVHLLGNMCDMDAIMQIAKKHGLKVIEDCAQAPGARFNGRYAGTIGDAGVFSFQQSKNITTGEGGMILTNDPQIARRARMIINHGEVLLDEDNDPADMANIVGCNFRLPELCAALGRAQLTKLDAANAWRNRNYRRLADRFSSLPGITPPYVPQNVDYVCHVGGFLFDEDEAELSRDLFVAAIRAEGIPMGTGYVRLMYENPTFLNKIAYGSRGCPWTCQEGGADVTYRKGQCPVAEELIGDRFLWLYHVAHPSTEDDMEDIASAARKVFDNRIALRREAETIASGRFAGRSQGRIK